jgi:hypothetical protein
MSKVIESSPRYFHKSVRIRLLAFTRLRRCGTHKSHTVIFGERTDAQASGPRLTVYNLFSTLRARFTLARMSLAEAVQMKGLGSALCRLMYSLIAPTRSSTL